MKYVLLIAYLVFAWRRLSTYLHIFQQEEYQPIRFIRWLFRSHSLDLRVSIVIIVVGLLELFIYLSHAIGALFIIAAMLAIAYFEKDPRQASKKKLVMTGRASRIYWVAFALLAVEGILYALPDVPLLAWLVRPQSRRGRPHRSCSASSRPGDAPARRPLHTPAGTSRHPPTPLPSPEWS